MKGTPVVATFVLAVLAAASLQWMACGDGDRFGVTVVGNVDEVSGESASRAPARESLFARVWRFFLAPATAQNGEDCPAGRTLFCVETVHVPEEGDPRERRICRRVNARCDFAATIRLFVDEDDVDVFFCDDENEDGVWDEDEPRAGLTNSLPEHCNGDQITLRNVSINYATGQATAGQVEISEPSACPPTPGPSPSPTTTGTPATPTPTVTGTPPTPTPTVTGTPPTPTPTVTGTPPTPTPTTELPECEEDGDCPEGEFCVQDLTSCSGRTPGTCEELGANLDCCDRNEECGSGSCQLNLCSPV